MSYRRGAAKTLKDLRPLKQYTGTTKNNNQKTTDRAFQDEVSILERRRGFETDQYHCGEEKKRKGTQKEETSPLLR